MTLPRAATAALTTLAVTAGTLAGFVPAASAAAPTTDLIAHYELDETTGSTVADSSGNGHDGTVVGTPTWTTGGLQLSGAPSNANYVDLPDGLLQGTASATVSMQVRADELAGTTDNFLWNFGGYSSSGGSGTGAWFVGPRNALRTTITPSHWSGEQSATWAGNRLTPGRWQNVTATIEPTADAPTSTLKLYVDGALVATNTTVTTSPATLQDHTRNRLGGSAYDGDRGFPGTIGETRVYGTALTAAQVADVVADDAADTAADIVAGISLGDISAVTRDLALPTGSIAWTTSDAAVVTATGVVTRPAAGQPDATVTLTATATVAGQARTRTFDVTVTALAPGEDPMPATADLRSYLPLNASYPGTPAHGTATFVGATNAPVWTSTHVDLTGGGYIANNAVSGLGLTGSSTASFDVFLPSSATGTSSSTLFTVGSNAVSNNLSFHPFYSGGKPAAVVRIGSTVVATAQLTQALPRDVWVNATLVLDDAADTLTVYLDGVQAARAEGVTATASSIGTSVLRLNREGWGFTNLPMKARDLRIYATATSAAQTRALARQNAQFAFDQLVASLDVPELVTGDLTLPGAPAVTWTSSDEGVVSPTGLVTQPAPGEDDATVTLTVSSDRGGLELTHDVVVTVPAALSDGEKVAQDAAALAVPDADGLRSVVTLPGEGAEHGSDVTWESSDAAVVTVLEDEDEGTVYAQPNRGAYGDDARTATLTATVTHGDASQDIEVEVTVPALPRAVDDEGYAFAYFTANTVAGENIYLAASDGNDALSWQTLNDGRFVLTSEFGEKGLRDPFILRSHEGDKFFLIATDLSIGRNGDWGRAQQWGSQYIEVWESTDLVTWSQQRHVKVSPDTAGMTWAPEAYWDDDLGEYVVFWASRLYTDTTHTSCITTDSGAGCYARMMYATTKDFRTFSPPQIWQDTGAARIDSTVLKDGDHYYRYTKDEGGQTGCVDIIAERSTSLTTVTTKASAEADTGWTRVKNCVARSAGFNAAVEGPTVFKANPGDTSAYDYYLYLDNYGGSGYFPLGTNDLASGDWSIAQGQLPASRHGTVMPVTLDQWQVLTGAEVEQTASTTTASFDEDARTVTAQVVAADGFEVGGRVTASAGDWSQTVRLTPGAAGTAAAVVDVPDTVTGTVTVAYAGTAEIAASSGQVSVPGATPVSLALTSGPTKVQYEVGQPLDLTGLAGTVTFDDDTTLAVGPADVTASGFSSATNGTKTVRVSYSAQGATVSATFTVRVVKATSTTTLSVSPTTVAHGGTVTLTARVTSAVPVTGTVTFYAGAAKVATATVKNGVATAKVTLRGVGTKSLKATYGSSTTVAVSSSPVVKVSVTKTRPRSIAVTSTSFVKGTRPTVVVTVGTLADGSHPVGKVVVTYGSATRTLALTAADKGVVRFTASAARTTSVTVRARFVPSDTANVASVTSAWRTMSPR